MSRDSGQPRKSPPGSLENLAKRQGDVDSRERSQTPSDDFARTRVRVRTASPDDGTIHDHRVDSGRVADVAVRTSGDVRDEVLRAAVDLGRIEHDEVGGLARRDAPASTDAEGVREL